MKPDIEIYGGHSQINPAATQSIQNNYYGQPAPSVEPVAASMVVVLGAGVDAAAGFPTASSLIPKITDWLKTEEGKTVNAALRKQLKGLRFHFDKVIDDAINRLAQELDRECDAICRHVNRELRENSALDTQQRKLGTLITRIFSQINNVKNGATIDDETLELITEVTGTEPTDTTLIDFSRTFYTKTFETTIRYILHASLHNSENPILRHVYTNLLDISRLLAKHFYGFFTNEMAEKKKYLYIAWTLWAYFVSQEQAWATDEDRSALTNIYRQLQGKEQLQVITFNYTSLAAQVSPTSIYFNGNLTDYVDVENKNDLRVDDIHTLDLADFFQNRLAEELSLEGDRIAIPIPSFMPPLKLKPVISNSYITTWYRSAQALAHAKRILLLGHSLQAGDSFFNDMLRANRQAEIIVIDRDLEAACRSLCSILQLSAYQYTTLNVQGHPARKYDNRIMVIGAELTEIDLEEWVK